MSRLKLPYHAFRSVCLCLPGPVIRGLTRFLTMAEFAEAEDGVVIIDCGDFYEEGEGGEHYREKVSRIEKRLVKLKEKIC